MAKVFQSRRPGGAYLYKTGSEHPLEAGVRPGSVGVKLGASKILDWTIIELGTDYDRQLIRDDLAVDLIRIDCVNTYP